MQWGGGMAGCQIPEKSITEMYGGAIQVLRDAVFLQIGPPPTPS